MSIMGRYCGASVLFSKTNCVHSIKARSALDSPALPYLDVRLDADIPQPLKILGSDSKMSGSDVQFAIRDMLIFQGLLSAEEATDKATVPQLFLVHCHSGDKPTEYVYIGDSERIVNWAAKQAKQKRSDMEVVR